MPLHPDVVASLERMADEAGVSMPAAV